MEVGNEDVDRVVVVDATDELAVVEVEVEVTVLDEIELDELELEAEDEDEEKEDEDEVTAREDVDDASELVEPMDSVDTPAGTEVMGMAAASTGENVQVELYMQGIMQIKKPSVAVLVMPS